MNERTIQDRKYWVEQLERRKLTEGSIHLTTIRPTDPPIKLLDRVHDGVHPYHSQSYFREIYLTQEFPDENR